MDILTILIALVLIVALTVSSLVFLVVLHKLEYFLNSKVIGDRIKNPMWLTLLGLIIGETLMGIDMSGPGARSGPTAREHGHFFRRGA